MLSLCYAACVIEGVTQCVTSVYFLVLKNLERFHPLRNVCLCGAWLIHALTRTCTPAAWHTHKKCMQITITPQRPSSRKAHPRHFLRPGESACSSLARHGRRSEKRTHTVCDTVCYTVCNIRASCRAAGSPNCAARLPANDTCASGIAALSPVCFQQSSARSNAHVRQSPSSVRTMRRWRKRLRRPSHLMHTDLKSLRSDDQHLRKGRRSCQPALHTTRKRLRGSM